MPRLSIGQRALWLSLRSQVSKLATVESRPQLLKGFDALPYHAQSCTSSWLPSESDLATLYDSLGMVAPPLVMEEIREATDQLRELAHVPNNDIKDRIVISDSGPSHNHLHTVQWLGKGKGKNILDLLDLFRLGKGKNIRTTFTVSKPRLDWLRMAHAQFCSPGHDHDAFSAHLFRLLCRYDGLAGSAGAGNQAAVPSQVYEAFERWAEVPSGSAIEAFASPLNHRPTGEPSEDSPEPIFGSAFPDVDGVFGSVGSFFSWASLPPRALKKPEAPTLIIANPPFLRPHLDGIAPMVASLVDATPNDIVALCVMPAQASRSDDEAPHCKVLRDSPLTRGVLELAAHEHGFCSGIAHRQTFSSRLKPSAHATAVYVLSGAEMGAGSVSTLLDGVRRSWTA